jgi:hypothetical protein
MQKEYQFRNTKTKFIGLGYLTKILFIYNNINLKPINQYMFSIIYLNNLLQLLQFPINELRSMVDWVKINHV